MTLFDDLKSVGRVLQEAGKIEQYNQILEAQKQLLEMQKKIAELEAEKTELREKLKIKQSLVYKNDAYWMQCGDGTEKGPFCPRCWDKNKDLLNMQPSYESSSYSICPECKNSFQVKHNPLVSTQRTYDSDLF